MTSPFYVYVAGMLSGPPTVYLANLSRMTQESRSLTEAGYVTLNPGADLLELIVSGEPLNEEIVYERSMNLLRMLQWVPAGHRALYVLSRSLHVNLEIEEALPLQIPVAYTRLRLDTLRVSGRRYE